MLNFNNFKDNFKELTPVFSSKKYLLAVSGGADSVVLAYLFLALKVDFEVAHINYHFRGEDSNLDQQLVENFCIENKIKLHIKEVTDTEKQNIRSLQNWARDYRYDFFFEILEQSNLDYIVTAHHLNDELETFIINLSRGSGIKGLSGIPKNENKILRPLLKYSKEELYHYAKQNNIAYREDASNKKNDYLRNKIRNQLIPIIDDIFPDFLYNFSDSISHLSSTNNFYQKQIDTAFSDISDKISDKKIILNKKKLLLLSEEIQIEIIRKFGFKGKEIKKILSSENGKKFKSNQYLISISAKELMATKL